MHVRAVQGSCCVFHVTAERHRGVGGGGGGGSQASNGFALLEFWACHE